MTPDKTEDGKGLTTDKSDLEEKLNQTLTDKTQEDLPEEEPEEELVSFGMDLTQLNEYLNNIIKVINQHASLLNTLNTEVQMRATER